MDPLRRFQDLLAQARPHEPEGATAMALATAGRDGRPAVRMVLLKGVDARGFHFFTNYESRKGRQIAENPWAALCCHWPSQKVQVRAEGQVARLPEAESDAYFATRPRTSQVGAWASRQSAPLSSRQELIGRCDEIEARFAGQPVPRPPFWGGYVLAPERIEFWFGHEFRLHDRFLYMRQGTGWVEERLYP